ncbi:MAG TPA: hypothetical protein VMS65_01865 [Polyangiaceae bacterium]|nr:hypothetical protein [Polyangiaceae bacterium]
MPDDDGDKPAEPSPDASAPDAESTTSTDSSSSDGTTSADSSSSDSASGESPPKKKKKKKKKKRAAAPSDDAKDEKPAGPALTAEGWERPGFVVDFPNDPELDRLVRAFELGNYAFVREHGAKLAKSAAEESVRSAANELVRRTDPDPLVRILLLMSVGLFLFMVFYAYRSHGH